MYCCSFLVLFRGEADVVGGDARDDLASFWLRKTKRPVLAVLLVQKKGKEPQLYRGTNMEVGVEGKKRVTACYSSLKRMLLCSRSVAYGIVGKILFLVQKWKWHRVHVHRLVPARPFSLRFKSWKPLHRDQNCFVSFGLRETKATVKLPRPIPPYSGP